MIRATSRGARRALRRIFFARRPRYYPPLGSRDCQERLEEKMVRFSSTDEEPQEHSALAYARR